MQNVLESIRQYFPKVSVASDFFDRLNLSLRSHHRFTPANTRFAEGACSDEINEPELQRLEAYWGERFKFGGLAGYCHGGRTGLNAVSHHVPEQNDERNLLFVGGPHIGWHDGQWGQVRRARQAELTTCCGSLMAIVEADCEGLASKSWERLDSQQFLVERIMLPFLKDVDLNGEIPLIVRATQFLMQQIDDDLGIMSDELALHFNGQIACVTGVTINTIDGNLFCPSIQVVRNSQLSGLTVNVV
jgi:hypothetical protein|tara:strand:- start:290 stop:1024 length:735 start_codon:yes stop_codon:yes gene_type:complete